MMLVRNIEKCLSLQPNKCGCGVIGSRARLRIWCREAWGFESLHPHNNVITLNSIKQKEGTIKCPLFVPIKLFEVPAPDQL